MINRIDATTCFTATVPKQPIDNGLAALQRELKYLLRERATLEKSSPYSDGVAYLDVQIRNLQKQIANKENFLARQSAK